MTRQRKFVIITAAVLAGLIPLLLIGVALVLQSAAFRDYLRAKIITVTEEATGGRVELSSFAFDLWHLRAVIDGFVLHGKEPAGVAPLFQAKTVRVDLDLFPTLSQAIHVRSVVVDEPRGNVIVNPDGSTNVPEPKVKQKGGKPALETVVDLAIGHFELRDGGILFADRKLTLDARGDNLRTQLDYNRLRQSYQGRISIAPLYLSYGRGTPLNIDVSVPLTLERDRIGFDNVRIATPQSEATLSGTVEHLVSPHVNLRANARLGLKEIYPSLGASGTVTATAALSMSDDRIEVSSAHIALGESTLDAAGVLKDAGSNPAGVQLRSHLVLGELGRLFSIAARPEGVVNATASASLTGNLNYRLTGNLLGDRLSFNAGGRRLPDIGVTSAITADPDRIALRELRVRALGGEFAGSFAIEKLSRFEVDGQVRGIDLETLARTFLAKPSGYGGLIGGTLKADGNLKAPGTSGLRASAQLAITPSGRGVPVSGAINATYDGVGDTIAIAASHLSLPHSRLDLSGKLAQQLDVQFHSTNLADLLPAVQAASAEPVSEMPVVLNSGTAAFSGTLNGTLRAPHLSGHLALVNASIAGRTFDQVAADITAGPSAMAVDNARISRGGMRIQADANIGLREWKTLPDGALKVNLTVREGDLADLFALAGDAKPPIRGALNADVHLVGTLGNPLGSARATVTNGVLYEQPFTRAQADAQLSNQRVTVSAASIETPAGNAKLAGAFDHPADSFTTGRIQVQFSTTQLQLGQLKAVNEQVHGLSGTLDTTAQLQGSLARVKDETQFLISAVTADLNVRGLVAEGQKYGDLTATARTSGSRVSYQLNSNLANSTIRLNGHTDLQSDYPTTADASLASLPIERLLALAGHKDIPARGVLSGTVQVSGTAGKPAVSVDLALTNAVLYDEPLDHVALRGSSTERLIDVPRFEVVDGPARVEGSLSYHHALGDFENGQAKFQLATNGISLARLHTVGKYRPGLAGTLELVANGTADIRKQAKGAPQMLLSALDAKLNATGLVANKQKLGDLRFAAQTTGDRLSFNLVSDIAGSKIEGHGATTLRADYPTNAELHFSNVTYTGLRPLIAPGADSEPLFEVVAAGEATLSGPATKIDALVGKAAITRLEVTTRATPTEDAKNIALKNEGSIAVSLDRSLVKVQHAHIVGPKTDIVVAGSAGIQGNQALDLSLKATTNLGLLEQMTRSVYSSGAIVVDAAARGTVAKPVISGRLELKNAALNHVDFPNGISNANGVIVFNGTNATIQTLTAESGGGKITATGFASYGGAVPSYSLKMTARDVRVRYPPGASIVARARLDLTGTSERSILGGTVLLQRIGFSPQSDFGSMLSRQVGPAQAPAAPVGPLAGMRLDVAIRTAQDVTFETSLAQNIQATADLNLRGTAESPGMLGRVTITQGDILFFGGKYTVSQGSVNFYDPTRIRPVLNVDLETTAKGVTVDLNVSGPVDNMKLTHHSDPPLQFSEIVALLATGRTPTSDPNLVAQQPSTSQQSVGQMGESALISQAISNPVSSRLARVFGVSQLKIDPAFTSGSELPQARVTLQQQITSNLTFTYISNLNQTNSQIIRVEWALNPRWVVVAQREETGRFGMDFYYKKSFR